MSSSEINNIWFGITNNGITPGLSISARNQSNAGFDAVNSNTNTSTVASLPIIDAVLGGSPDSTDYVKAPNGTNIYQKANIDTFKGNYKVFSSNDAPSKLAYLSDMMWTINQKNAGNPAFKNIDISYSQLMQELTSDVQRGNITSSQAAYIMDNNGWT